MSLDDHRDECDGVNCDYYRCASIPLEELQQRVIDLWNANQGWIPGGEDSRRKLADALGVSSDLIRSAQDIKNSRPWTLGEQGRWDGAPDGAELVSFLRDNGDDTVRVRNDFYGIRNIPRSDLKRL